jgi:ferredoxin
MFIALDALQAILERLSKEFRVWVPAAQGEKESVVHFMPYKKGVTPVLNRQSTLPLKGVMLPQVETLLTFEQQKDPADPSRVKMRVEEPPAPAPAFVFGARPCDVKGFQVFDKVFSGGPYRDNLYEGRRDKTLLATLVCREGDDACFCSSVGSGPADKTGSDIQLTPVDGGFVAEALTDRAKDVMKLLGEPAAKAQKDAARKVQKEVAAERIGGPAIDSADSRKDFNGRFKDLGFWRSIAEGCLSCGVCTFVCPTCYCFTISDESKGLKGERLRSWDSCMFCNYTAEASGHNPRPTKLERYRNRVGHKFSYIPEKYDELVGCCGCGRCIRSCPVSIDIREAVQRLKEDGCEC